MAKIFSILTLLAAALALYLGLESGKRIKELQAAGTSVQTNLSRTQGTLKTTEASLKASEEKLASTTADLETSRAKQATAEQEATKAKADLTAKQGELDKANGDLAAIQKTIDEILPGQGLKGIEQLKISITELTTKLKDQETKIADLDKQRAELDATVKTLESTKKEADERIASQGTTIKRYTEGIMQKGVRGKVMAVNSGWGFAVLSIGDRQGAAANKVMIVARGGQAIGKVRITNVEATQSVADILPGTFVRGTYVQPGDDVIFTGEDKVKVDEAPAAAAATPAAQPALPQ
jgi:predicted RNase H-like nuclease (RuvC/YqgF family)